MKDRTYLTAISRKKPSLPVRYLQKAGLLKGKMLDFGCGRGFDCDFLKCDGYDPHFRPEMPKGKYDTIFCVYVLNVLPTQKERQNVLDLIYYLLDGSAYIAIRLGMKQGWTSRGTYQESVDLDFPVIKETSTYRIHHVN
jgi:hypothetical protein